MTNSSPNDAAVDARTALVAGGSGSLGSAVAAALVEAGHRVVVTSRVFERAEEIARRVPGTHPQVLDVASVDSWKQARREVEEEVGPVEIFVAASGVISRERLVESDPASWAPMVETNLMGVINGAWTLVPRMIERGFGRVIAISSVAASVGCEGRAVYGATKAGVEGFCRGLAVEVAGTGVTVNCVAAGAIHTEFNEAFLRPGSTTGEKTLASIPERRYGATDDVAGAVMYLVGASYSQGATLRLDGGWTIRG